MSREHDRHRKTDYDTAMTETHTWYVRQHGGISKNIMLSKTSLIQNSANFSDSTYMKFMDRLIHRDRSQKSNGVGAWGGRS